MTTSATTAKTTNATCADDHEATRRAAGREARAIAAKTPTSHCPKRVCQAVRSRAPMVSSGVCGRVGSGMPHPYPSRPRRALDTSRPAIRSGREVLPGRLRGGQVRDGGLGASPEEAVRHGQPDDLLPRRRHLARERARRVGQAVPAEEVLHLRGDLLVAVARQVREEMVLDLEAEVAGHEVHGLAAADVGRTEHLAEVPLAAGLPDDRPALEGLDALGEVA